MIADGVEAPALESQQFISGTIRHTLREIIRIICRTAKYLELIFHTNRSIGTIIFEEEGAIQVFKHQNQKYAMTICRENSEAGIDIYATRERNERFLTECEVSDTSAARVDIRTEVRNRISLQCGIQYFTSHTTGMHQWQRLITFK